MSNDDFLTNVQRCLLKIKLGLERSGHSDDAKKVHELLMELDDIIGGLVGERLKKWQGEAEGVVSALKRECSLLEKCRDDLNAKMDIADKIVGALAAAEKVVKQLAKYV